MRVVQTASCQCHWSLKVNTEVNVNIIATSTDESEQPVRSECQSAWTDRTSSRAAVPARVLPPVFGPVADYHLKAVGDGWLVRSNLTRPLVVH